jgi:hypothetical protein
MATVKQLSKSQIRYRDDLVYREKKKAKSKARYHRMSDIDKKKENKANRMWKRKHYYNTERYQKTLKHPWSKISKPKKSTELELINMQKDADKELEIELEKIKFINNVLSD